MGTTDPGNVLCIEVKLSTAKYGHEISWNLGSCKNNRKYDDDAKYTQQCCLGPGSYSLRCKDSYGDGWNGAYIEVDGKKYCESFTAGREETSQITLQKKVSNTNSD